MAGRWAVVSIGAALLLFQVEMQCERDRPMRGGDRRTWMMLGLFWSASPIDMLGGLVHWLPLLAIMVWSSEQLDVRPVLRVFSLGAAMSLPFAIAQRLGFHPVVDASTEGWSAVGGLFLTSNVLAEVSSLGAVLALGLRWWPVAAACAVSAVLTGRREVALMLVAAGIVWLWGMGRRWSAFTLIMVAGFVASVSYLMLPAGIVSDAQRLDIWRAALSGMTLPGHGLNTFGTMFPYFQYAHSDPLQLMFELGVGAVPLLWLAWRALGADLPVERCAFAAFCASAFVWFPLEDPVTAAVACLLAGRLLGERDRVDRVEFVRGATDIRRGDGACFDTTRAVRPPRGRGSVVPVGQEFAVGASDIR